MMLKMLPEQVELQEQEQKLEGISNLSSLFEQSELLSSSSKQQLSRIEEIINKKRKIFKNKYMNNRKNKRLKKNIKNQKCSHQMGLINNMPQNL